MFAVVFEVHPKQSRHEEYLALAKHLKPILESIDGFIDNERFTSKRREGWMLSLSTWRDEKSLVRWYTQAEHHKVQERGRSEIFEAYHLRVGDVTADSHPPHGHQVQPQRFDTTTVGVGKVLAITELTPERGADVLARDADLAAHVGLDVRSKQLADHDVFESIYNPGKMLLLTAWVSAEAAAGFTPAMQPDARALRHRAVRVIRDYGMFDRREAPQWYPDVARGG